MDLTSQDRIDLRRIEKEVLADCEKGNIPLLFDPRRTLTTNEVSIQGNILDSDFTVTFQGESVNKKSSVERIEEMMKKYNDMLNEGGDGG